MAACPRAPRGLRLELADASVAFAMTVDGKELSFESTSAVVFVSANDEACVAGWATQRWDDDEKVLYAADVDARDPAHASLYRLGFPDSRDVRALDCGR